ncbi:NAD-dependent epimerase/dehydratase family protein [Alphaproteobacteria bacterium]|nr:NAD-dependent epimerase/dehydratase family protein [Alphaproteobacteria bacterium]
MENIKILLTGGSGFIGRPLLKLFESRLIDCTSIGRSRPLSYEGHFIEADLLSMPADEIVNIMEEIRPTHLVHLAWCVDRDNFWESEQNLLWIGRTALLVKKFCESGGSSVLVSGSCAEYSWDAGHDLSEDSPCFPKSLYGMSKHLTRQLVAHICNDAGVQLSWCRIFFPYGPDEDERKLVPSLKRIAKKLDNPFLIKVPGSRDFVHVDDVANAIVTIILKRSNGIVNISSGKAWDLHHLMASVLERKRPDINVDDFLGQAKGAAALNVVGNNQRLKSLGWNSTFNILPYIVS